MLAAAKARVRELELDVEAIRHERQRLIEDMSAVAQQQLEIVEAAGERFPRAEADAEDELGAADQPAAALPDTP